MDVKLLRYFVQICKDKSFSKASKNLYITQQGLSRAIKNLEEYVQVPLFYRKINGVEVTKYGEYLEQQSMSILNQFDLFLSDISQMNDLESQKLSVGFSLGVLDALSTDLISDFKKTYPQIELDIYEGPDYYCEEAVLKGDLDIAFTIGPINKSKFHSKVVKTQHPCVLINEKNPLSKKSKINFDDLKDERFIITNQNFKIYHNFISKCRQANFQPNIVFSTTEIHIVHKLSRLNKGLGISIDFIVTDINYPNIRAIPFADETFVWEINFIHRKDYFLSGASKMLLDYVMNY